MGSDKKIVAIGGGTGLSILLRGIKEVFEDITAIVNVVDDGGSSGMLREDMGMLPPGDIRNCLLALAETEPLVKELFDYRFNEGRLSGQSFGNLMIAAMTDMYDNFEVAVKNISKILAVKGRILPATIEDIKLVAELKDGTMVIGESVIPYHVLKRGSEIEKVSLKPSTAKALEEAEKYLLEAEIILIGPGSLYTSILPNLLVTGIADRIKESKAIKVFLPNLMTQPGETDRFTIRRHIEVIEQHVGDLGFSYVLVNEQMMEADVVEKYQQENSKQILIDDADKEFLESRHIKLLMNNFLEVKCGYVRHNALKIANVIDGLF